MKIVVGYDGSECADAALDDLRNAGLPLKCSALVVTVAEVWLPPPPPSAYEFAGMAEVNENPTIKFRYEKELGKVEEAKALAARAAARLKANFPGWEISTEAAMGSPAWELISKAENWKPDLIVVGSHGRSALGRLILGSVSQRVLTEALCSVRIARGRVEESSPVRIIVAVDGSPGSEAALGSAAAREWPALSEARVVVVDDPIEPTAATELVPFVSKSLDDADREFREKLAGMVEGMASRIKSTNLAATAIVAEGDPKRVILKMAEEWGGNLHLCGLNRIQQPH